jgi:hypothetical protein
MSKWTSAAPSSGFYFNGRALNVASNYFHKDVKVIKHLLRKNKKKQKTNGDFKNNSVNSRLLSSIYHGGHTSISILRYN